jgi:pyrimidine deaminase RibD-like protein
MHGLSALDTCLFSVLKHLRSCWHQPQTGIVACALVDGENTACAVSTRDGEYWQHAERLAYQQFINQFGKPSKNAVFVVTLSPCIKPLKYRQLASCAEFIKSVGLQFVHTGIIDNLHASSLNTYAEAGLQVSLTRDPSLMQMCRRLMNLFAAYDARVNHELPVIKQELGDAFFEPLTRVNHYYISTDKSLLDVYKVHSMLKDCFWSRQVPLSIVERSIQYSLCFGIYTVSGNEQVGFGRVISDFATYAYVTDIVIDEKHRKSGLAYALFSSMQTHLDLQGLKTWSLRASDEARQIYLSHGFSIAEDAQTILEISDLDIYLNQTTVDNSEMLTYKH